MNQKAKRDWTNALAAALCDRGLAPDTRIAAEQLRTSGVLERLGGMLPIRSRLVCGEVAEACAPLLGETPERG